MNELFHSYGRTIVAVFTGLGILTLLFTQIRAPSGQRGIHSAIAESVRREEVPAGNAANREAAGILAGKSRVFHPRADLVAGMAAYPLTALFEEGDGVRGGKILCFERLNDDGSVRDLMSGYLSSDGRKLRFPDKGMYHIRATLRDEQGVVYYRNFYFTIIRRVSLNR